MLNRNRRLISYCGSATAMALSRVVSLESLVSKIPYNVLMWTLNPTNSLTRVVFTRF